MKRQLAPSKILPERLLRLVCPANLRPRLLGIFNWVNFQVGAHSFASLWFKKSFKKYVQGFVNCLKNKLLVESYLKPAKQIFYTKNQNLHIIYTYIHIKKYAKLKSWYEKSVSNSIKRRKKRCKTLSSNNRK